MKRNLITHVVAKDTELVVEVTVKIAHWDREFDLKQAIGNHPRDGRERFGLQLLLEILDCSFEGLDTAPGRSVLLRLSSKLPNRRDSEDRTCD